ncbi:phage tail protein [Agrobacterium tumefaciens]|uniref:phage tail protein n=1 Tax=Agrobacterium tumefaciens TaxID=358 RepID=UPI0021D047D6|nr:phage tail protein [Agrobacterium tumefaciens]UXT99926.1 phage tail protein [Agrobacterium tumefaciens]
MAIFTSVGIAAALSTTAGFFTAAAAFVLNTAVGIGVSLLAKSLAGKPKDPTFSINGTLQGGGDVPRSFILGRTATAGSLVFVNTWGQDGDTPNAYLTQVIALSDMPVRGLAEVWVNGERVTLGGLTDRGYAVNEYADSLWIKFYDGTQTTADSFLFTSVSNGNRWWNPDRVGRGVAYAIVTARVSKNMFSGVPSFKFVLEGMRLYDISRDSTQGGVGPQRFADPSTWGGDGDFLPAVQIYNLLRGISYNGQWFYGLQNLSSSRLPGAAWIAQIEKHRALTLESTGWENTYRSGGEIQVEAPLTSAVEALLTACQGRISEVGGVYYLHSGAPDAPVIAFTDDDILSTEEQEFTPFLGLADTINGVSANYPSPVDGWVVKTAPPLYRTDLEAIDGNRRLMADVDLNFVPYAEQVQRLMKSALEEARRFRRHTIVLPPKFWAYATPGTVFSWTSERNGYIAKLMRIDGVADRANLDVMIDITEVDPADYDWSSDTEFQPPVDGQLGVIRPTPQPIVDWFVEPWILTDSFGESRRPAIRITWDNTDGRLDDVVAIEYEVRLQSSLEKVSEGRTDQPEAGSLIASHGLLPNETYGVRGRYIPGGDRPTSYSGFMLVTTPNVRLGAKDIDVVVDLTTIGTAVRQRFAELQKEMDDFNRRYEEGLSAFSLVGAVGQVDREEIRAELGTARAEITDERRVRVTENEAMAQRVGLVSASVDEANAKIITEETARVSADEALSESLIGVSAELGDRFAQGLVKFQAVAAPSGVDARFSVLLRGGAGDAYKDTGFFLELYTSGGVQRSRMAIKVDQFSVSDGTTAYSVFAIEGGVVKIINALIDMAQINNLIVGTSNIEPGAITATAVVNGESFTVTHGTGAPNVLLLWKTNGTMSTTVDPPGLATATMRLLESGNVIDVAHSSSVQGGATAYVNSSVNFRPPSGRTQTTFSMDSIAGPSGALTSGSRISQITALVFKR